MVCPGRLSRSVVPESLLSRACDSGAVLSPSCPAKGSAAAVVVEAAAGRAGGSERRAGAGWAWQRGQRHNCGSVHGSRCSLKNQREPHHPCEPILNASGIDYF